ncbi:MAG: hypothetical protein KAI70_07650 [Candidatus Omnitrophica bacterium]|nr:hypothetical protein [Candidatus Omnitrophota bacterium]
MMAVGGGKSDNMNEYFSAGVSAVAFGDSVFRKDWLEARKFTKIKELIKKYTDIVKNTI